MGFEFCTDAGAGGLVSGVWGNVGCIEAPLVEGKRWLEIGRFRFSKGSDWRNSFSWNWLIRFWDIWGLAGKGYHGCLNEFGSVYNLT